MTRPPLPPVPRPSQADLLRQEMAALDLRHRATRESLDELELRFSNWLLRLEHAIAEFRLVRFYVLGLCALHVGLIVVVAIALTRLR